MTAAHIQYQALIYITAIAGFLIIRAFLIGRLLSAAKPLAAEIGKLAGEILESKELPEKIREIVTAMCHSPTQPFMMPIAVIICIPAMIYGAVRGFKTPASQLRGGLKEKYNRLVACHFFLNAARSPIAFVLFVSQILLILPFLLLIPFEKAFMGVGKGWTYIVRQQESLIHRHLKIQNC